MKHSQPPEPGPDRATWHRVFGWQFLMFCQVGIGIVYGSVLGLLAYLSLWGFELAALRMGVKSQWLKSIEELKGFGFFATLGAYVILELIHVVSVHWPSKEQAHHGKPTKPRR